MGVSHQARKRREEVGRGAKKHNKRGQETEGGDTEKGGADRRYGGQHVQGTNDEEKRTSMAMASHGSTKSRGGKGMRDALGTATART